MADSGTYTPEAIARRLQIAQQLLDTSRAPPVRHWTEGLNQLLQGYLGGDIYGRMENAEAMRKEASKNDLLRSAGLEAAPSAVPPYQSPLERIAGALGGGSPAAGATPAIPPMTPPASPGGSVGLPSPPQTTVSSVPRVAAALTQPTGGFPQATQPGEFGKRVLNGNLSDIMLDQPRAEVPSSPRVMGDKEAVAAGLYRGPPTAVYPQPTGLPSPISPGGPATANPPSAFPSTPGQPQTPRPPTGFEAIPEATRRAAVGMMNSDDPQVRAEGAKLLSQAASQASPNFTYQVTADGTIIRLDPKGGPPTPVYQAPVKPEIKMVKGAFGEEVPMVWDSVRQTLVPPKDASGETTPTTAGGAVSPRFLAPGVKAMDSSLTGQDYLNQFSPEVKAAAIAYHSGEAMPTGNPRTGPPAMIKMIAQKYGQDIGAPVDDTTFAARRKLRTDLASSNPNTMGGILSNGLSAFGHLAQSSDQLVALNSASGPNFPGGAHAGRVANYLGNVTFQSPKTAEILAENRQTLGKYGAESTKFYAGTGGGEGERGAALREFNPQMTLATEQAGFLRAEKSQMLERLHQKEDQIRRELGDDYLQKHPIMTTKDKANLDKIDRNIAILEGTDKGAAPPSNVPGASPITPNAVPTTTYSKEQINAERVKRGMPPL